MTSPQGDFASEERFRAFVMASSDVVYSMSPDWTEMRHLQGRRFIADTREPSRSWLDKYIHPDDQPGRSTPPLGQRILVVDDNADAAVTLAMLLRTLGADVKAVHSGPEALDLYGSYEPEVVLLDIGMPGMDGYEVARRIRERDGKRPVALVALTGWGQEEHRQKARNAGFDHHIVKPAEIGALQALLSSLRNENGAAGPRPGSSA